MFDIYVYICSLYIFFLYIRFFFGLWQNILKATYKVHSQTVTCVWVWMHTHAHTHTHIQLLCCGFSMRTDWRRRREGKRRCGWWWWWCKWFMRKTSNNFGLPDRQRQSLATTITTTITGRATTTTTTTVAELTCVYTLLLLPGRLLFQFYYETISFSWFKNHKKAAPEQKGSRGRGGRKMEAKQTSVFY